MTKKTTVPLFMVTLLKTNFQHIPYESNRIWYLMKDIHGNMSTLWHTKSTYYKLNFIFFFCISTTNKAVIRDRNDLLIHFNFIKSLIMQTYTRNISNIFDYESTCCYWKLPLFTFTSSLTSRQKHNALLEKNLSSEFL